MKKNTSIKKNFILSMFFQILNIITPLITAPYISRVLGANAVGIYSEKLQFAEIITIKGVSCFGR